MVSAWIAVQRGRETKRFEQRGKKGTRYAIVKYSVDQKRIKWKTKTRDFQNLMIYFTRSEKMKERKKGDDAAPTLQFG